jgi:elongation factor Ts
MAEITAKLVKDLRERTDLPMMECKQALTECSGDMNEAIEWLRKKHKGKLADRSDKVTGEGRISVWMNESRTIGGIVELQCETAPVAKNEMFVALADDFARKVGEGSSPAPNPDDIRNDPEMDKRFTDVFGRLRESMKLAQCRRVEGAHLASYIHHDGKSGVLLALDAAPKSDKNVAADLCMHALFTKPVAIERGAVSLEQVEKVRAEARELAKAEGKPDQIVEKIAEGKVNAFFAERVLVEQLHVKTDDYGKQKVGDVLKAAGVNKVTDLVIMVVGG